MRVISAKRLLDQLDGATIVSSSIENDEGFHLNLQDGRVLVVALIGEALGISILRVDSERLH